MHRQNIFFITLVLFLVIAIVAVGYATGRGPLAVVSAGISRGYKKSAFEFVGSVGAYSVDARLFGLRVTVVPPRKEKTQLPAGTNSIV
jgi:hypothetical protein